jgi:lipoate synthase
MAYDQVQQDKLKEIQFILDTNINNVKNIIENYREEVIYIQSLQQLKRLLHMYSDVKYKLDYTII